MLDLRSVYVLVALGLMLQIRTTSALAQFGDIDVTPTTYYFGEVSVGNFSDNSFVVSNTDDESPLIIFNSRIEGEDADQFRIVNGGGGAVLPASEFRLVTVSFSPTSTGNKSAALVFESDDPDENPLAIPLSGSAFGVPDIFSAQSLVVFGEVFVGSDQPRDVIISNAGTEELQVDSLVLSGRDQAMFSVLEPATPFTMAASSLDTLSLQFSPESIGLKSAQINIYSSDPDENPFTLAIEGIGVSALIDVSVREHLFGEVPIGEAADFALEISNSGTSNLVVDSIAIDGDGAPHFLISEGGAPFIVPIGETRSLGVRFAPSDGGEQVAVLTLFNNDPTEPALRVTLRGTSLVPVAELSSPSIDFGQLLAGLEVSQFLTLRNRGRANLAIIQQRIADDDSTQFILDNFVPPVVIAPDDSLQLSIRFAPTSEGDKRSTLRLLSNDPEATELVVPLFGQSRSIAVQTSETIALGEDVVVTLSLPDDFQPFEKDLLYRSTGETAYRVTDLVGDGPEFQGIIPGVIAQLAGVEFFALITDGTDAVTAPPVDAELNPFFLPVRVEQLQSLVEPVEWTYQMVSVPLVLDDTEIDAVLMDDYGEYDTRRLRLFRWQGDAYAEYPDIEGGFDVGKGFWLITNESKPFDIENGESVNPIEEFQLELQPGWNQIGNPFALTIPWPAGTTDPRIEAPVAFDGVEFLYDQTVLVPWLGYFVFNQASVPLTVLLRARGAIESKRGASHNEPLDYRLRLLAETAKSRLKDLSTYIGFSEQATSGMDPLDRSEAPPIGEYVRISVVEEGNRYAGNVKPLGEGGQYWDLEVDGTVTNEAIQVRLVEEGVLPEGYQVHVLDQDNEYALAVDDSTFTINLSTSDTVRKLRLIIGAPSFVEESREGIALQPTEFRLDQNFPNPFDDETTIRYRLGAASLVSVDIYNMIGQRVRQLVSTTAEAGLYELQWDGRDDRGRALASGLYIYRLRAGEFTESRKMVIVR